MSSLHGGMMVSLSIRLWRKGVTPFTPSPLPQQGGNFHFNPYYLALSDGWGTTTVLGGVSDIVSSRVFMSFVF
jgi:hypothetical protein